MNPKKEILLSSLSLILIMAVFFFFVEIAEGLLMPMIEGVNELNILLIDALIPTIIIAPFLFWLFKSRSRFEKALAESEKRFRTLFESAPDAIFLADPKTGIIIGANSRASELTARPHEEIIGMHQAQLHPSRNEEYSRGGFKEHVINTRQKENVRPIENYVLRPDGTEVPVEVLAKMVTIKGRQVMQGVFRDITKRKKGEKERERLFNAINRSTEGITIADENDRFVYVNEAYARIFGLSQEELIGDTWRKITPSDIIGPTEKGLSETLHNRNVGVFHGEVRGLRKDGTIIPTDVSATGFWDSNGKYQGHVCIVKDITERKNAEKRLEKSLKQVKEEKAKTQSIIAAIGDAISVQDTDFKILYQNKIHQDIAGIQKGKYCYREYEHRDQICEGCPVKQTFMDGNIHTEERRIIKNEKELIFEITASPLMDSNGNIIAGIEVARNITERKQIERKLVEEELFLESIFTSIQDGIGIIDKDMNILKVNQTAKMWYPHVSDFEGRKCYEVYHGRSERCEICPAKRTFETGKSAYEVVPKHGRGGKIVGWLEIYSYPLMETSSGEMKGVIEYVRDISERKKTEEELLMFKHGIERSDESIFITDIDGSIIYVNPAFEKTYGYSREEALGKTPRIIKSGMLPSEAYKPFWDTLLSKNVVNGELVNKTKDGRLLNIGGSANPIVNSGGDIIGFLAIQRDITGAKKADEMLKKNMSMLEKAQEIGQMGNWEWDIATNEVVWSDQVYKLYGLDPAKDHIDYDVVVSTMTPETRDWFLKAIDDALKHGMSFDGEYGLFQPDGTIRYTHTRGEVTRDKEGNPVKMFGMVQDITERKRDEEILIKNRSLLDTINRVQNHFITDSDPHFTFDNILTNLLSLTNSEFGFIGEVLYTDKNEPYLKTHFLSNIAWNDETMKFYEANAPAGMEFHNLKTLFGEVLATGKPVIANNPATDPRRGGLPEGHPQINSFIGIPFYLEDKFIGMVGIANHPQGYDENILEYLKPFMNTCANIIEAYRNDQRRKLAEKQIEESLKEKDILLREIHHRVKNNMQIVSSLLWLQSEHIRDNKDLEIFKDSQNRIMSMSLVHEKLYRSKDLSGIDIKEYIRDLTNNLLQSYGVGAGTIEINIDIGNVSLGIDSSIPCGLIINELVTNSLKYAFPENRKGEIRVSLRNLNENKLELRVGDNGVGIPGDVDFRTTESLGLRLVTILTENQLHGEINLDRSMGTEFKIKFKGVK